MANRLTYHSGYRNAMGKAYNSKHDQREAFSKKPRQADRGRATQNVYWDYGKKLGGATFSENETLFYQRFLGPTIERKNKKAIERRQYGRTQTVAQYKEKHPPEEVLLYLGTENVNVEALEAVFRDFRAWLMSDGWDREKGGIMPLNAALHLDETTPHIHFRQVYLCKGKDGGWEVSQNKALEALGYQRPDPTKPTGKYNNAKMTFTAACRGKLQELARSYGVELETEPLPKTEVGLPLKEYVQREQAREAAAAEQRAAREAIDGLEADIADLEDEKADAAEDLERLRRSTRRELEVREQKREEAKEQGYRDGYTAGVQDGAQSALGRLNERLRERREKEKEEQEDLEHEGR